MYANFSTCRKYRSAAEHKDQVERERLDQAAASNYALASSNPGIASPLAAIPKDDGDVRLTHDAKRSVGTAMNDHWSLHHMKFQNIKAACKLA